MSKKSPADSICGSNETTETTLAALALQINAFVLQGSLDSRCAVKLVKRLKKEADAIREVGNSTKLGQNELNVAFEAVDATLRDHDAALLVMANAALRSTDDKGGTKKSK
ncbi:hypothetical protein [Caballeronia sp. S22]|uniref:hypothetical protein n=1 Tax=Caballeronia sp. S22 TaxID=3137182 RepID=UPI003530EF40